MGAEEEANAQGGGSSANIQYRKIQKHKSGQNNSQAKWKKCIIHTNNNQPA